MATVLLSCRLCGDEVRRARASAVYTHLASAQHLWARTNVGRAHDVGRSMGFFDVLGLGASANEVKLDDHAKVSGEENVEPLDEAGGQVVDGPNEVEEHEKRQEEQALNQVSEEIDGEVAALQDAAEHAQAVAVERKGELPAFLEAVASAKARLEEANKVAAEKAEAARVAQVAAEKAPRVLSKAKAKAEEAESRLPEPAALVEETAGAAEEASAALEEAQAAVDTANTNMSSFEAKAKKQRKKKQTNDEKLAEENERRTLQDEIDDKNSEESRCKHRLAKCKKEEEEARKKLSGLEAARDSAVKEAQAAETRAQKATADLEEASAAAKDAAAKAEAENEALARADEEAKAAQATLSQAEAEATVAQARLANLLMSKHVAKAASVANDAVEARRREAARRVTEHKAEQMALAAKQEAMLDARSRKGMNRACSIKPAVPRPSSTDGRGSRYSLLNLRSREKSSLPLLPDGWEGPFIDPATGRRYYVDLVNNTSSWIAPVPPAPPVIPPRSPSNLYPYARKLLGA